VHPLLSLPVTGQRFEASMSGRWTRHFHERALLASSATRLALERPSDPVEITVVEDRRHMTAVLRMVSADDAAVRRVVDFVRAH
jgi:hypothetical protein